jgi:hypothetical protein
MNLYPRKRPGFYIYLKRELSSNLPLYKAARKYKCGYRVARQFNELNAAVEWIDSLVEE